MSRAEQSSFEHLPCAHPYALCIIFRGGGVKKKHRVWVVGTPVAGDVSTPC